MATGFPATTGDIFTAADYNGLVTFDVVADKTADYTVGVTDSYQVLVEVVEHQVLAVLQALQVVQEHQVHLEQAVHPVLQVQAVVLVHQAQVVLQVHPVLVVLVEVLEHQV